MHKGVIIVIEDDRETGDVIRRVLLNSTLGYDVVLTQHGMGAVIHVDAQWTPLVITDYQMPDMDGIEAIQQIKARSPQTKIIAISGVSDRKAIEAIMRAGADYFLRKPFSVGELMKPVLEVLNRL